MDDNGGTQIRRQNALWILEKEKEKGAIKHVYMCLFRTYQHPKYNIPLSLKKRAGNITKKKILNLFSRSSEDIHHPQKPRKPPPVSNKRATEQAVGNSCRRRRDQDAAAATHTPNLHNPREKVMDSPHSSQHSINGAPPSSELGWAAGGRGKGARVGAGGWWVMGGRWLGWGRGERELVVGEVGREGLTVPFSLLLS